MKTVLYFQCSAQDPDHHSYHNWRQYFIEAGWTVIDFDYEIERFRLGAIEMRRLFRLICTNEKPDLVWHGLYLAELDCDTLSTTGCPVIGFACDDSWRVLHSLQYAHGHDIILTTEPGAVERYNQRGHKAAWVPWCVTPSQYPPASDDGQGVVFVGQKLPYREKFIRQLSERGLSVRVYGRGWGEGPELKWGTMIRFVHEAAVVLGICEGVNGAYQVKARHVEIPALGRVHVVNDDPNVTDRYGPLVAPCRYRDADECVDVIRTLLDSPGLRREIAGEARADVLSRFTWDTWLTPVIEEVMG